MDINLINPLRQQRQPGFEVYFSPRLTASAARSGRRTGDMTWSRRRPWILAAAEQQFLYASVHSASVAGVPKDVVSEPYSLDPFANTQIRLKSLPSFSPDAHNQIRFGDVR